MQVILNAINAIKMAVFVLRNSPHIAKKLRSVFGIQNTAAIFCGEDNVVENLGKRGHGAERIEEGTWRNGIKYPRRRSKYRDILQIEPLAGFIAAVWGIRRFWRTLRLFKFN